MKHRQIRSRDESAEDSVKDVVLNRSMGPNGGLYESRTGTLLIRGHPIYESATLENNERTLLNNQCVHATVLSKPL